MKMLHGLTLANIVIKIKGTNDERARKVNEELPHGCG